MRTELFVTPAYSDPRVLLGTVESAQSSFLEGRRNNDLVNWFVLKLLVDLDHKTDKRTRYQITRDYQNDFFQMMGGLSSNQRSSLRCWEQDPAWKVEVLCEYYAGLTNKNALYSLWLPAEYEVRDDPQLDI